MTAATGWEPRVGVQEGVKRLNDWLLSSVAAAEAPAAGVRSLAVEEV